MRERASIAAIASEQGIHPNSLRRWKALYRAGQLRATVVPAPQTAAAASATFLPVTILPGTRVARVSADTQSVVQITLSCGSMLRIETGAIDGSLVCALVAELKR